MKEEIMELLVNDTLHKFFFDGQLNKWRSTDNKFLVPDHSIDLVIDVAEKNNAIDWKGVTDLIIFLNFTSHMTGNNVENCRSVLWAFFKVKNKKVYENDFFQNIVFNLSSIHFNGSKKHTLFYDYHFYPLYSKGQKPELGKVIYKANFRDRYFLGVSCDETTNGTQFKGER